MKRHQARGPLAVAAAALAACTVCSCAAAASHGPAVSAPSAPASSRSPVSTPTAAASVSSFATPLAATISWFAAVNAKNRAAAVAHFVPADASMMDWGNGDTSTWSTFSRLHCKPISAGAASATVLCTFDESQSPSEGSPDNFWTVSLARQQDGRWLIDNYGTG